MDKFKYTRTSSDPKSCRYFVTDPATKQQFGLVEKAPDGSWRGFVGVHVVSEGSSRAEVARQLRDAQSVNLEELQRNAQVFEQSPGRLWDVRLPSAFGGYVSVGSVLYDTEQGYWAHVAMDVWGDPLSSALQPSLDAAVTRLMLNAALKYREPVKITRIRQALGYGPKAHESLADLRAREDAELSVILQEPTIL